jgi:hypothetical protein
MVVRNSTSQLSTERAAYDLETDVTVLDQTSVDSSRKHCVFRDIANCALLGVRLRGYNKARI